jgi:CubicO group peptidase (beta-lactamase class C family)/pimeloyl-ACP methyl ester carboxylesterase
MSTLSGRKIDLNRPMQEKQFSTRRLGRRVGMAVFTILGGLVGLLSLLPVALLPFITAVPLALCLLLVVADVGLLLYLFARTETWVMKTAVITSLVIVSVLAVLLSQWYATTPPILGADGQPLPGSIAELERVELNGRHQWITIRSHDAEKPVLLFLAGGPGGSQLAPVRRSLSKLEEHFIVVNWEQPGASKSFNVSDRKSLTPETYIEDATQLVSYLQTRFDEEKVYVLGESWGSALGIMLVQRHPELFHAFIGTGQMVAFLENDLLCYDFAMNWAHERGDTQKIEQLQQQGPPPYYGDGIAMKQAAYLMDTFNYMNQDPNIPNSGFNTFADLASVEYGLLDKVNWVRGPLDTLGVVYPHLWDVDFRQQAAQLDVPVYFLIGRHDVNAPVQLTEEYFELLDAPHKELIWFEKSGHTPWTTEPDLFVDAVVNTVLPSTYSAPTTAVPNLTDAVVIESFFDDLLPKQLNESHIAGAAVAVVVDDTLLFSKGYGFADVEALRPVVADQTLFRTDSTGKLFVWTAVMQLVEQGKLDLGADVNGYLDFSIPATFAKPITLRHLFSHSAGFEDMGYMFAHNEADLETPGAFLAAHIPARVRPPGELTAYSNYGTALAGYIVERVSGLSFEQYVDEFIFSPLGMAHSTFRQPLPPPLDSAVTQNNVYTDEEFRVRPFQFLRIPPAGEGHMTVTDMAPFMIAHLANTDTPILKAETNQQMHGRLFSNDSRVNGFAYGFAETTQNGQHILRHEGNNPGMSSTALFLLPEHKVGVYAAYNSNGGFGPGEALRRAFLDHFFPSKAEIHLPIQLTSQQKNVLTGSYRSTRLFQTSFGKVTRLLGGNYGDVVVRANDDGTFTTQGIGPTPLRWTAVAPDVLQPVDEAVNGHGSLVFGADEQGQLTRLFISNNPYRAYEKIAWYEGRPFHILLLALCLLAFLSAIAAPLLGWVLQRQGTIPAFSVGRPAASLLFTACILNLLFLAGLALTFEESLLYGVTTGLGVALSLPLIALGLTAVSLFLAFNDWMGSEWGLIGRIHYGLVAGALLVFAGWLAYWNLLGFRF